MTTFRKHGRMPVRCTVKLEHQGFGETVAEVRDISDTGAFLLCGDIVNKLAIGDAIRARTLVCYTRGAAKKIPSQLTVVRLTEEGAGFAYE